MDRVDNEVAQTEEPAGVAERVRHGQGHSQERAHSDQDQGPPSAGHGRNGVGQPGIAAVHPENDGEYEHYPAKPARGQVIGEQRRRLRDGEDEDQIEEELERGDPG